MTWELRERSLTLPVALRPDFIATIQVPRDITKQEAERLIAMIRTLPLDSASPNPDGAA